MKLKFYHEWILSAFIFFFMISCAQHRPADSSLPTSFPDETLPQIGGKKPDISRKKAARPEIIVQMIKIAENQLSADKPKKAFHTLERALDMDGQDPVIWHLMARSQQMQHHFQQAEYLARKSNTMAAGNTSLKKKNWQIIGNALEQQGRFHEAEKAYDKAGQSR